MKLSAYIVTLNEETRLPKTLEAIQKIADEIVVVDSGSADKTQEIAEKYGAKFIFNKWETYCKQKHFAEQICQNDWVLLIDADEVLSPELIKEIKEVKKSPKANAYKLKIIDMFPFKKKPPLFAKTFKVVRLYNKKVVSMPEDKGNKDRVCVPKEEKVLSLKAPIYHYSFLSIFDSVAKYNLHSSEMQKTLLADKRKFCRCRLFTEFPRQFLHYYFAKRMCFGGVSGFSYAMILAYFRFLKIAKWFEYTQKEKN